jgi:hypothetical protein
MLSSPDEGRKCAFILAVEWGWCSVERDPTEKSVFWDFADLPYEKATEFNVSLLASERACFKAFVLKYGVYVPLWEYGYYFLGRYLDTATVTSANALAASLFIDAYGALRSSFLVGANGYLPDSLALLRKTHESFVRAVGCAAQPARSLDMVRSSDIRKTERDLGLNLEPLYRIESGFTHSNRLRSLNTMIAVHEGKEPPLHYGPQVEDDLHGFVSKAAAFWLYFGVMMVPCVVAPTSSQVEWLLIRAKSAGLLPGYLRDSGSGLLEECKQVEVLAERRGCSKEPA